MTDFKSCIHASLQTAMSLSCSRSTVLALYRTLLRKGRRLELTDKDFYLRRIRHEFEMKRGIESEAERLHCIEVCIMYTMM